MRADEEDELIGCARREFVAGNIDVAKFEAAVEHVLRGGRGDAEFPFLPVFAVPVWTMELR
jgi:hypothetical protein